MHALDAAAAVGLVVVEIDVVQEVAVVLLQVEAGVVFAIVGVSDVEHAVDVAAA